MCYTVEKKEAVTVKCSSCNHHYYFSRKCPLCGATDERAQNRSAKFLLRPLEIGPVVLNVYYLYILVALNLSVLSVIVNILTYQIYEMRVIWSQYVAGVFLICGFLLKIGVSEKTRILSWVRRALYVGFIVCAISQIPLWKAQNFTIVAFVIPALLILFDLFGIFCFLAKWSTSGSFFLTLLGNTVISLVPFILMFFFDFPKASVIVIDLAFGGSLLAIANTVLLKLLSLLYRLRGGNRA